MGICGRRKLYSRKSTFSRNTNQEKVNKEIQKNYTIDINEAQKIIMKKTL